MYALLRLEDPAGTAPRLFPDLPAALAALDRDQARLLEQLAANGEGGAHSALRHEIRPRVNGALGDPVVRSVLRPAGCAPRDAAR